MNTIHYNGHTLTWQEHSTGKHTFVCIPGHANVRSMWVQTVAPFFHMGRFVTLDLPGHYPAHIPLGVRSMTQDEFLDLETHAIRDICNDEPVTLIGHSTGGLVVLGVAARLRQQVVRVISVNSVLWGPLTGFLSIMQRLLTWRLLPLFTATVRLAQYAPWSLVGLMASFYAHQTRTVWRNPLTWETYRESFNMFRRLEPNNLALVLQMLDACDIRATIMGLPIPTLAITGAYDPVVVPKQTLWLADNLPNVALYVFDAVGHVPNFEVTAQFQQVVGDWLVRYPVE